MRLTESLRHLLLPLKKLCFEIAVIVFLIARESPAGWREEVTAADSLFKAKQYASAISQLDRALASVVSAPDVADTAIATIHHKTGNAHYRLGEFGLAAEAYARAVEIRTVAVGREDFDVSKSLFNYGRCRYEESLFAQAENAFRRVIGIRERVLSATDTLLSGPLQNRGLALQELSRYDEAEECYLRAVQIETSASTADSQRMDRPLVNLGYFYREMGRFADAADCYARALCIRKSRDAADPVAVASVLNNLAGIQRDTRNYAAAESLLRAGVDLHRQSGIRDSLLFAETLGNLGSICLRGDRIAEAENHIRLAADIAQTASASTPADVALHCAKLGVLLDVMGKHEDAERFVRWSLFQAQSIFGPTHPRVASLHSLLAVILRHRNFWEEALGEERLALDIRRGLFARGAETVPEMEALQFARLLQLESHNLLSLLLDDPVHERDEVEIASACFETKGVVARLGQARRAQLRADRDPAVAVILDSLRAARQRLSEKFVSRPAATGAEWNLLETECERLERELNRHGSSMLRDGLLRPLPPEDLAAHLAADAALVEFVKYNHRRTSHRSYPHYLAVVLRCDGHPGVVELGPAPAIDSLVSEFVGRISNHHFHDVASFRRISSRLYGLIWQPLAQAVGDAREILVSPDGSLHRVSFASLVTDEGDYLMERHALHLLNAGSDVIGLETARVARGGGLLAFADPDFNLPPSGLETQSIQPDIGTARKSSSRFQVGSLPATRNEVRQIAEMWNRRFGEQAEVYTGRDATEERFKKVAHGSRVIHLATHGFFVDGDDASGGIALDDFEGFVSQSPFLQSGLLFAGANRPSRNSADGASEDGILTAEEALDVNLSGTALVVLSSCESGRGEMWSGEGVYGLARAMRISGAGTVICSLWRVDDRSTAEFMKALYSTEAESIPQLMQSVTLERLSFLRASGESDHPYYWGAFVAIGDRRLP